MQRIHLYDWQNQILETKGNICVRAGRQVGKSTVISRKAGEFAVKNRNKCIMVISATERQAYLLFEKILSYVHLKYRAMICSGKKKPTKHKIELKNGSIIHCLPVGETGYGIRGYTINLLIADEAAFIPEEVFRSLTPSLAATGGKIILLSTPHGREGYFARCFSDSTYSKWHISSEQVEHMDKEFLAHEKQTMTKMQYMQEYQGEFVDQLLQFFSDNLIKACQTLQRFQLNQRGNYYLGVDIARMGGDETTYEILERGENKILYQRENIALINQLITETTKKILELEEKYNFKKIYLDDGGLGVGVFDFLLNHDKTKRKVIAINNAKRSLDRDDKRKKTLFKEDLYNNLLNLMERNEIKLLDDPEIFQSLKSIQFEISDDGRLKIFGRYTHIVEGLIRAAWCMKDKTLNICIRYI